ncbi:hypothetical protein LRS11_03705 [Pseudomonas sp. J452]|uniref:hypothetical protein n=1 Tax=Pseudomonas sp. J452 TaxID=2898441 RepID=UPI0021AD6A99|nr:hypothetical protein [Pseudomonas sp. J452]UUY09152.1 hypothetical protein LRS11_03705 [Pseudomonas sp. J452]
MAEKSSAVKDFIYGNLPYLLVASLALILLLAEKEIAFGISRRVMEPSRGLVLGLTEQRMIAALLLVFAVRKIWLNTRR